MTPRRVTLEVFEEDAGPDPSDPAARDEELDDTRLAAFEQGYKAGWDDASAAQADEDAQRRALVARAIAAVRTEQAEARRHVLAALRPLIEGLVAVVLPGAALAALPSQIVEAILPYAEFSADLPVDIALNPASAAAAEAMLLATPGLPALRIIEDDTVGEAQAFLRHGAAEARIDLDAALQRVSAIVSDYFNQLREDQPHG